MNPYWSRGFYAMVVITCWLLPQLCPAETMDKRFTALVDEIWQYDVRENPLFATSTGDHRLNDRLPTVSVADSERRNQARQEFLTQLKSLDRQRLSPTERINYDILHRQLGEDLAEFYFQTHLIPITQRGGFHIDFPELPKKVPLKTTRDYKNYTARLRAFGDYTDGHIELMRAGIAAGQTLPAVVLEGWRKAIDAQIVERPTQSLLYEPCKNFPGNFSPGAQATMRAEISAAIAESVVPGYRRFRDFMAKEYVPEARPE